MENKQQTAIQELISEFEELKRTKLYQTSFKAIDDCIALAYNKLAMEKEQIIDSYKQGKYDGDADTYTEFAFAEQYYDETFEK